jgi:UDP-glucose 4-epimerase
MSNPARDFERTVVSTAHLLEFVRLECPASRVVAISSAAVFGSRYKGPIAEGAATDPCSVYGYNKLMMEELCRNYSRSYGIRCAIVRLFSAYGPWLCKQLIWDLCSVLQTGAQRISLGGTGGEVRDWGEIQDVVRAVECVGSIESQELVVINGGSGIRRTVSDFADTLVKVWGGGVGVDFSGEVRKGDPFCLLSTTDKLAELGFRWNVDLSTGIRRYVQWYKNYKAQQ